MREHRSYRLLPGMALCMYVGIWGGAHLAYSYLIPVAFLAGAMLWLILGCCKKDVRPGAFFCCLFLGIFLYTCPYANQTVPTGTYKVTGVITSGPKITDGKMSATLSHVQLDGQDTGYSAYWSCIAPELALCEGQTVSFTGRVYTPSSAQNPGEFDFAMWVKSQGLRFCLYGCDELYVDESIGIGLLYRMRTAAGNLFDRLLGKENSALAKALVIGTRTEVTQSDYEAFQQSGAAHLLAISGLHISILAGVLVFLLSRLHASPWVRFLLLAVPLGLYCVFTGLSASVVRAGLMAMVMEGHRLVKRKYDMLSSLSFSAILLLCWRPAILFSISFQLSFGAILGICLLVTPARKALSRLPGGKTKVGKHLVNGLAVTLSAQAGVMIPISHAYGQVLLLGIFSNLVLIPLSTGLLLLYYLLLLLGWVPGIGHLLGFFGRWATMGFTSLVHSAAGLPFVQVSVAAFTVVQAVLLVAFFYCLTDFVRLEKKKRIPLLCTLALLFTGAFFLPQLALPEGTVRYTQLSVGQADCAVLMDGEETVVIDTGEDGSTLTDYLNQANRQKIDTLFITHAHMDHAGGLAALLEENVPIGQILLPWGWDNCLMDEQALFLLDEAQERGIPVYPIAAGDTVLLPHTKITVLWPYANQVADGQDANVYSLSLYVQTPGASILCQGDLDGLFEMYTACPADILKVAHHASIYSTSEAFLAVVQPQAALVSVGNGSTALPSPDTLLRLENSGAQVLETRRTGAITITLSDGGYTIETYNE